MSQFAPNPTYRSLHCHFHTTLLAEATFALPFNCGTRLQQTDTCVPTGSAGLSRAAVRHRSTWPACECRQNSQHRGHPAIVTLVAAYPLGRGHSFVRGYVNGPREHAADATIERARIGDRAAWELLYLTYAPTVLGYLRSQRADGAEDLLGDVWVRVVGDLPSFSGGAAQFRAWILRIAHNRLVDHRRVQTRRNEIAPQEFLREGVIDMGTHVDALTIESGERLEELLEGLPDSQRAVVYMRFVLDLPQHEIAEVLDSSIPAIKMLQQRALRAIASRLENESLDAHQGGSA